MRRPGSAEDTHSKVNEHCLPRPWTWPRGGGACTLRWPSLSKTHHRTTSCFTWDRTQKKLYDPQWTPSPSPRSFVPELLPQLGGEGEGLELAQFALLLAAVVHQHQDHQHKDGREHSGQHGAHTFQKQNQEAEKLSTPQQWVSNNLF